MNSSSSLISPDNVMGLWCVCLVCVGIAVLMANRFRWAGRISGAMIALLLGLLLSNLGLIPTSSSVWDSVWNYIVPLAVPMMIMRCDIRAIGKDTRRILTIFFIGSIGTVSGSIAAYELFRGSIADATVVAGLFSATYTGGAINYDFIGGYFNVPESTLTAISSADNLMMVICLLSFMMMPLAGFFRRNFLHPLEDDLMYVPEEVRSGPVYRNGQQYVSLKNIAMVIGVSVLIVAISTTLSEFLSDFIDSSDFLGSILTMLIGNRYLWICLLSIVAVELRPHPAETQMGAEELGRYIIYIFFFVNGVPISLGLLADCGLIFLAYAAVTVCVNMLFCFIGGKILNYNLEEIIVASNASIGGPVTAAALSVSKGWTSLTAPAMLTGIAGYLIGSYLGIAVVSLL